MDIQRRVLSVFLFYVGRISTCTELLKGYDMKQLSRRETRLGIADDGASGHTWPRQIVCFSAFVVVHRIIIVAPGPEMNDAAVDVDHVFLVLP